MRKEKRRKLTDDGTREGEVRFADGFVEGGSDIPCQFQVLDLVFSDWDLCCPVEEDVGGHEDWVGEETELKALGGANVF